MKYAAFYIVYRRIFILTQKPLFSLLAMVLLLAIPAFVFDGKVIGPEYLIMLLVAWGWSSLLSLQPKAQIIAAFCFVFALVIKINVAPLGLIFLPVFIAIPANQKTRLLMDWMMGAIVPVLLFFVSENPFKEIFAIGATHHVDYGFQYLSYWYSYNALEFDEMLKGGWRIDFITWWLFGVFLVYAVWQSMKTISDKPAVIVAIPARAAVCHAHIAHLAHFFAAVLTCFLTSLNSLMHPWFVFAPFLLLLESGVLLIGARSCGRDGGS